MGTLRRLFAWTMTTTLLSACGGSESTTGAGGGAGQGGAAPDASMTTGTAGASGSAGAAGASGQPETGGGGASAGRDSGTCTMIPSCSERDAASCPTHHDQCIAGMCCKPSAEAPDCVECTCDTQCPNSRPFCESGRCTQCLSKADCPPGLCCGVPVSGGPHACLTMNCIN